MFQTGFHNTPVDSIAMCVTCSARSQSESASRSSVIVPKVRTSSCGLPCPSVTRTQAITESLCTSNPATR